MKYASVTEVVRRIKDDLCKDYRLQSVAMEGSIINLKRASNGHYYMNLRDDNASIHAILFASRVGRSMDSVREGDHVVVIGAIQVYEKAGSVSFIIERLFSRGVGALQAEYERIKKELAAAGYFDSSHKREIPRFPWRVGVLTSRTGAVLHDIEKIRAERNPYVEVVLFPIPVQGAGAEKPIAEALKKAGTDRSFDVLILARGGGSMEDLWCFNSPAVVQAVYHSAVPVISAIGHETDTTLADYAADQRAATPTHAAEMVFPSYDEMVMDIAAMADGVYQSLERRIKGLQLQVSHASGHLQPQRYESFLRFKQEGVCHLLTAARQRLALLQGAKSGRYESLRATLQALDPAESMRRGYGQLEQDGHILSDIRGVSAELPLFIQLVDGTITTMVKEVTIHDTRK